MRRLEICFIVFSIVASCPQVASAEADTSAILNKIEEAYSKEGAASQTNYFVPVAVQTSGGNPGKYDYLSNELIVLYDFEKGEHSSEDIVDAANGKRSSPALIRQLENPIRGRFLIPFRLSQSDMERLGKEHPRVILQDYVVLEYPSVISPEGIYDLAESLAKKPLLRWVENNNYLGWSIVPGDPFFLGVIKPPTYLSHQWGMEMLNLSSAWDYVKGTAYIAALDNGIETTHPDIQNNFRPQFSRDVSSCTSLPCNDPDVDELKHSGSTAGHGTHVAGIMAAYSSDHTVNIGVAGACWNCSLMIGKISGGSLSKKDATLSGVEWLTGIPCIIALLALELRT